MSLFVRKIWRPNILCLVRFSSSDVVPKAEENELVIFEDENANDREAEIENKRNISRLSRAHFNIVNGRKPHDEPKIFAHSTLKYNRRLFGKYGFESGVDPRICWPSKEELEDKKVYEKVAHPFTIPEMMAKAKEKREAENVKIRQRDEEVALKYAKLEQWKKELNDKMNKKTAAAQAAKAKKERLVEEVRRHFGFKLDPKDERFQEMLAKREKEQRKEEKLARRLAKEKEMIAKLQQKSQAVDQNK